MGAEGAGGVTRGVVWGVGTMHCVRDVSGSTGAGM